MIYKMKQKNKIIAILLVALLATTMLGVATAAVDAKKVKDTKTVNNVLKLADNIHTKPLYDGQLLKVDKNKTLTKVKENKIEKLNTGAYLQKVNYKQISEILKKSKTTHTLKEDKIPKYKGNIPGI